MRLVEVSSLFDECYEVPYVPTSVETVKRMLQIAEVGPDAWFTICVVGTGAYSSWRWRNLGPGEP